jgi:hypothetical protein
VISRKNSFDLGAGSNRVSSNTGEECISVSQSVAKFGTIPGNVAAGPGDDPAK